MLKTLVVAAILMATGAAWGQQAQDVWGQEAYGTWKTITSGEHQLKFQVVPKGVGMFPDAFQTQTINKLPQDSDIVRAPLQIRTMILGFCNSKTYQIRGYEVSSDPTATFGGEDFTRKVIPGTPIDLIFRTICK
jgi:predicted secreted protein